MLQVAQRSQEQSRADQEQQRERHLRDDQRFADQGTRMAGGAPAGVFERGRQVNARRAPRGDKPEQQPGQDRNGKRKREHAQVQPGLQRRHFPPRKTQLQQQVSAPEREEQTKRPTRHRQQRAFGEQLSHKSETSRAQRQPHGDFFLSLRRARQQQVGYIDARDQQDQPDHRRQQIKRLPLVPTPVRVAAPARL